jgi:hypothetical protein
MYFNFPIHCVGKTTKSHKCTFCGTGVWTQAFALVMQALYPSRHIFCPFCFGSLEMGSHILHSLALPAIAGVTIACHIQIFSIEMGHYKLFCPGWPGSKILLIFPSHIAWYDRCLPPFSAIVWDDGLMNILPWLVANHSPPDLSLPSS